MAQGSGNIDYIMIEGYKSIRKARIDIKPINILIGANGSGKSNLLSFFNFLSALYEQRFREYVALQGGEDKFLFCGKKVTPELSFHLEFAGSKNAYSVLLKVGENRFVFASENLIYEGNAWDIAEYGYESKLKDSEIYRAHDIRGLVTACQKFHFHDTGSMSPFTKDWDINKDGCSLYSDGGNIAAYLYHIRKEATPSYTTILKTIQSVAPYFSDFYLEPNREGVLRLLWKDKRSELTWGVRDLSDGTLRFIALATLFLQPKLPSVIVIDEPELGLHPFAIAKLAGLIQSAAARGCQVITATQSAGLISHFKPEDIVTVDLIDGATEFKRLDSEELTHWLDEYSLGELWERDILNSGRINFKE